MAKMLVIRSLVGGTFMGLANLVPGISGGTMLLASGIYPNFIQAMAEIVKLKFNRKNILVLGSVGAAACLAVLLFAGTVRDLVVNHRWVMYSIFIGLTLGGIPLLKNLIREKGPVTTLCIASGIILMLGIAVMQNTVAQTGGENGGPLLILVAGMIGASAMILPGISGGYLLLIIGVYVPILTAIDQFKIALAERNLEQLLSVGLEAIVPFAIGTLAGIAVVSQVLKKLLDKCENQTYAVLYGVLLGAIFGLWPFQTQVPLQEVTTIKGQTVEIYQDQLRYVTSQKMVQRKDIPTTATAPTPLQGAGALALILAGFGFTLVISKLSDDKEVEKRHSNSPTA